MPDRRRTALPAEFPVGSGRRARPRPGPEMSGCWVTGNDAYLLARVEQLADDVGTVVELLVEVWSAVGSSGQSVGRRAWVASRMTAQASATGPTCPSLSGLITERIVWIRPSSTSSVQVLSTLLSRSRKIAPGWPFTSCGSNSTPIRTNQGKVEASTRATFSAPMMPLAHRVGQLRRPRGILIGVGEAS